MAPRTETLNGGAAASSVAAPPLPTARGELSAALLEALAGPPDTGFSLPAPAEDRDPLLDEDLQLALYACYELHYRGFAAVDPAWEWSPALLAARESLERRLLSGLEAIAPRRDDLAPRDVGATLFDLAERDDAPPLSRFLEARGTRQQLVELVILRSAYQLKEADPHSWAIPRLAGAPKSALVEIQADEYGSGRAERMHSRLFADTMEALGLDSSYGAHLDLIGADVLAGVNMISLFGLHRRRRGALVGHLAMFEITSAIPNRRYGNALRRLGFDSERATAFYDEHVEADSVHENIAAYDLAEGLARAEPELTADIVFGAAALLAVDGAIARRLLEAWRGGGSALRAAAPVNGFPAG